MGLSFCQLKRGVWVGFLLFSLTASTGDAKAAGDPGLNCGRAQATFSELQNHFYQPILGKWKKAIWWNQPNILQALIDESEIEASNPTLSSKQRDQFLSDRKKLVHSIWVKARLQYFGNFINLVYDDQIWWALASIRAFEFTGDRSYLDPVWRIFSEPNKTWGQVCSGGVYWKPSWHLVSTFVNELFFLLSARMALIETDPLKREAYQSAAQKAYDWFFKSGLIFDASQETAYLAYLKQNNIPVQDRLLFPGLIANYLTTSCQSNFERPWTYNQGVVLAALVAFSKGQPALSSEALARARLLADVSTHASVLQLNGALNEPPTVPSNPDTQMFKGVYSRDLSVLNEALPDHPYDFFYERNGELVWKNGRDSDPTSSSQGLFNFYWGRWIPWGVGADAPSATKQVSALELYISACRVEMRAKD